MKVRSETDIRESEEELKEMLPAEKNGSEKRGFMLFIF